MPKPARAVRSLVFISALIPLLTCRPVWTLDAAPVQPPLGTWYFAVSGDSRDCGDLIMPKIARDIEAHRATTPAEFYWHLGDFRRLYGPDCDFVKHTPGFSDWDCQNRPEDKLRDGEMSRYLDLAWDDFLKQQIEPFGQIRVFLGIGNHELAVGRTRDDFRRKFQKWLISEPIHLQRVKEAAATKPFYSDEGETFYHFVKNGVDFISLDNADAKSFTSAELLWFEKVLANDQADTTVRTIVVGMHEALPHSSQSWHAMDASCQGLCSGQQVYDLLYRAQSLGGKHVYVFASHSHVFRENVFAQPEHANQVLTGWIVGTAGAEQYLTGAEAIRYGYALAAVHPDGTLAVSFREVTRDSQPLDSRPGGGPLTEFCFTQNRRPPDNPPSNTACACGQTQP